MAINEPGKHISRAARAMKASRLLVMLPMALGFFALAIGQILLARGAGQALFGQYSLLMAWINFAAMFAVAGHQYAIMRVVPPLAAEGNGAAIRFVMSTVARSFLAVAAAACAVIVAVVFATGKFKLNGGLGTVVLALPLVVLVGASQLRLSLSSSMGQYWLGQGLENIARPMLLGGGVYLASLMIPGMDLPNIILVALAAGSLVMLAGSWALWRKIPAGTSGSFDKGNLRRKLNEVALFMGGSNIVISAMKSLDIIIVGSLVQPEGLAAYVVITRLAEMVSVVYFMIDPLFMPKFSVAHEAHDQAQLAELAQSYCLLATGWNVVCLLASLVAAPFFLNLFGAEYVGYAALLPLALVAHLINAATGAGGQILPMIGLARSNFWTSLASAALYALLAYWLASNHGIAGALYAYVVYQLLRGLSQGILVRRATGVSVFITGALL